MLPPGMSPTQEFINILDIRDDSIILKGGQFCAVLESSALNFDLLSEKEQDAAIFSYANFVNSLNYPIQVVIKTRRVNIDNYINFLEANEKMQPSEALREQMRAYTKFIKQLVIENVVLYKRFFIVIPYLSATISSNNLTDPLSKIFPFMKKPVEKQYDQESFKKAKQLFDERTQEINWHFRRLGIEINRLKTQELIKLYFEIYNPQTENSQLIVNDFEGYMTPFVKTTID